MTKTEKLLNFHTIIQVVAIFALVIMLVATIAFTLLSAWFYLFVDSPDSFWQIAIGCFVAAVMSLLTLIGNMVLLEWRLKRSK